RQFEQGIKQSAFHVFGIKKQDRLLAYVSFSQVHDEMEIFNIAVEKTWRRKGLASRLLGFILQMNCKMGIKKCYLEVRESNLAARRLYEKFGFHAVGRRKGYYPDTGEDAIIMRAEMGEEVRREE
ncbi:MAG: ribosomal protein S18-alanine N-acetyltransferase, partial [Desulfovibrionales bacterium]